MVKVSVCISTWNRKYYLNRAIISILKQDFKDWEIIVVDNCSTDGTDVYLKVVEIPKDKFRYKIMPHSNFTAMQTLNEAFKMASGEYILVLDDDARLINEDAISELVKSLDNNKRAGVVGANILDEDGSYSFFSFEFHGACAMFRRFTLECMNYYDESFGIYMNELDLSLKMILNNYEILYNRDAMVYHKRQLKIDHGIIQNYNKIILKYMKNYRFRTFVLQTIMTTGKFVIYGKNYASVYHGMKILLKSIIEYFKVKPIGLPDYIEETIYNQIKNKVVSC